MKLILTAITAVVFLSLGNAGAQSRSGVSERELSALQTQVISSKAFVDYKAARGIQYLNASLKSIETARIAAGDPVNHPPVVGAPIYEFKVTATYQLKRGSTCAISMAVVRVKGKREYDGGSSDGGCGE